MNSTPVSSIAAISASVPPMKTSEVLRGILTSNPKVTSFSVQRILSSIGSDRLEASLMMFSLPAIVPVPSPSGVSAVPVGAIAYQLASGEKQIRIPKFILNKCVSRRALAVAIHSVLPMLEAAEKVVRPRMAWVNHSAARRAVGMFLFLLAAAIAYPLFGFNPLHATSVFVVALGMAEQDGLAVLAGIALGVLSLATLAVSGLSAAALRAKAGKWLRKLARRLGFEVLAQHLHRRGYKVLARLLTFQWSELLLLWDPEKSKIGRVGKDRWSAGKRPAPVLTGENARSLTAARLVGANVAVPSTVH